MALFEPAFDKMINNEGGYKLVNVEEDKGGQTYAGISRNYHGSWKGWRYIDLNDFSNPELKELVKSFYKTKYWDRTNGDKIKTQKVAESIFDFAVNAGVNTSAKLAQGIVGAVRDGKIGPKTLAKLTRFDDEKFILKFSLGKVSRYAQICKRDKSQNKFLLGWVNRSLKDINLF